MFVDRFDTLRRVCEKLATTEIWLHKHLLKHGRGAESLRLFHDGRQLNPASTVEQSRLFFLQKQTEVRFSDGDVSGDSLGGDYSCDHDTRVGGSGEGFHKIKGGNSGDGSGNGGAGGLGAGTGDSLGDDSHGGSDDEDSVVRTFDTGLCPCCGLLDKPLRKTIGRPAVTVAICAFPDFKLRFDNAKIGIDCNSWSSFRVCLQCYRVAQKAIIVARDKYPEDSRFSAPKLRGKPTLYISAPLVCAQRSMVSFYLLCYIVLHKFTHINHVFPHSSPFFNISQRMRLDLSLPALKEQIQMRIVWAMSCLSCGVSRLV